MQRRSFSDVPCSIARSLDVFGDWWNPLIVRECLYGVRKFDELQSWLGIGRNILARRLETLVGAGVLEKRAYESRPPRFEYHLTEKGYDAAKLLVAMMAFGETWAFEPKAEPIHVFSRKTGRRVRPAVVDAETGKPLQPEDLFAGPGPGFPPARAFRQRRFVEYYERKSACS